MHSLHYFEALRAMGYLLWVSFLLQKVKEMIFKDIVRIGKEAGLKTFEQVEAINDFS